MNMMLGMLKSLLPNSGDYRLRWYKCSPPDENTICFSIEDISEEDSPREIVSARVDWPKK